MKRNAVKLFPMKLPENAMMVARLPIKQKAEPTCSNNGDGYITQDLWGISIRFEYQRSPKSPPKVIAMVRLPNDSFSNTVQRLKRKFVQRSVEAMTLDVAGDVTVRVEDAGSSEFEDLTNEDVFFNQSISSIKIDGKSYRLIRDAPECTTLKIALEPTVGYPLLPSYDLSTGRKEADSFQFRWYVESSSSSKPAREDHDLQELLRKNMDGWELRHVGPTFFPQEQDVGKYVCVVLDLGPDSIVRCAISEKAVAEIDTPMIFEERQRRYCQERCENGLRVMSYNVLADLYLNLGLAQEELFFPYCPKEYQEHAYRYPILLKEISGYNADLIFLQEVDERLHRRFLPQYMERHGYVTHFKKKGLLVNEGLAICFREDRLRAKSVHDVWLTDLLDPKLFPENGDVVELLEQASNLKQHFMSRPAVLQLLSLDVLSDEGVIILAANTHLHFHPLQENIKVLQALLCARYIARTTEDLRKQFPEARVYHLFAGDFNSTPAGAVYDLLTTGTVSTSHQCWKSNIVEDHPAPDEIFSKNSLSTGLATLSSLALDPPYTNYTRHQRNGADVGFAGCLDYIWGTPSIKVLQVIPMPSDDLVMKYVALPSKISPSDHLPLICDIRIGKE